MILRYSVTPLGGWTYIYLEDLGDKQYTRGGSRVRTINNPFEFTESWQLGHALLISNYKPYNETGNVAITLPKSREVNEQVDSKAL